MKRPFITQDMIVAEVIEKHPEVVDVLFNHGIQCFGCGAATTETLGDGYRGHYGPDADVVSFMEEVNGAVLVEVCYACQSVSSYDEPLYKLLFEGQEKWVCKKCM